MQWILYLHYSVQIYLIVVTFTFKLLFIICDSSIKYAFIKWKASQFICVLALLLQKLHVRHMFVQQLPLQQWLEPSWLERQLKDAPIYGSSPAKFLLLWINTEVFLITHRHSRLILSLIWFRCFNSKTNGKMKIIWSNGYFN